MPGPISLSSIVSMMNAAANDSQRAASGDLSFLEAPPEQPLETIKSPGSGKRAYDEATAPSVPKITDNMLPVDPNAQLLKIQSLDADQQNYLMQAFKVVNTARMS